MRAYTAAMMTREIDGESDDEERRLTDYEAASHTSHLQQLIAESEARTGERFVNFEKLFVDALGEAFAKERRKIRDELKRNVDEQVTKLRTGPQGQRGMKGDRGEYGARGPEGKTGPQGPRGMTGAKGEYGARGPEGKTGPQGKPGATIVKWEIDRKCYSIWPVMSDGTTGPALELRGVFEQFVSDVK